MNVRFVFSAVSYPLGLCQVALELVRTKFIAIRGNIALNTGKLSS